MTCTFFLSTVICYDYTGLAVSLVSLGTFEKFEVLQYVTHYLHHVCIKCCL